MYMFIVFLNGFFFNTLTVNINQTNDVFIEKNVDAEINSRLNP